MLTNNLMKELILKLNKKKSIEANEKSVGLMCSCRHLHLTNIVLYLNANNLHTTNFILLKGLI